LRRIKVILAAVAAMMTMTVLSAPAMAQTFVGTASGAGNDGIDVSGVPFTFDSDDIDDFVLVGVPGEDDFLLVPEDAFDDGIIGQGFSIRGLDSGIAAPGIVF
jgi:hypothetical protein